MHVASLVKLPWNGATNLSMAYRTLDKSVDEMVEDFELGLKTAAVDNYSRRLVEFCSLQALQVITSLDLGDKIHDGSLSRFTFDMMLAWETPTPSDQQITMESIAKEREERKEPLGADGAVMGDETSLFYSDIMPLLVNEEPTVGEDTYVWFGSLFPLACDVINARFTFEALTATTASRLHYPAHDRFLKEMNKSLKFLQEVPTPTGIELAADEFILHMEGTAGTQRVVRHIGTASWPGRLTLTNKALYFEASGKISYKPALKVELSATEIEQQVKTTSTGPFGAPLFDKGIKFELLEPLVLEFPEMTSSTRRDMWITLIREVIFLHRFISMYSIDSPIHKWEVHSRIILGVIRLHAAREMLRMSPLPPSSFLVFSLYGELPKGDFVLEQLASNLKETSTITSLSASHVFKGLSKSLPVALSAEIAEDQHDRDSGSHERPLASLENTIGQVRDEAREATVANAAIEGMEEEGIIDSLLVLVGLVSPISKLLPVIQQTTSWNRPFVTGGVLAVTVLTIYKEWIGLALAASLMLAVGFMVWARKRKSGAMCSEFIIDTSSDKTTMESLVEAQQSLKKVHEYIKTTNVVILRISSIALAKSPKHTEMVIWMLTGLAVALAVIPFKYSLIGLTAGAFMSNTRIVKVLSNPQGCRRWREWWESIPAVPVRAVDKSDL
ncbi:hypothetical protein GUJ93_ZPchr0006g44629 [Zizania palustris]|uniref:Uncharacterized protein n=1 Tax=Zizania palustris TaxID=103762 RepID=A0A8J5SPB4_ZIZPA|nr:hypothetical protein GUJ93_ZPchr0006g44629 [Zizania palustris]KAG8073529.1 hypothetical protein GUJ93_ZPchr0006g44629 [Zizania palustris]